MAHTCKLATALTLALGCVLLTGNTCEAQKQRKKRPANAPYLKHGTPPAPPGQKKQVTKTENYTVKNSNGQTETKTRARAVIIVVPQFNWDLGMNGWCDNEGFNIDTVEDVFVNGRQVPAPGKRVTAFQNGQQLLLQLEPGDVIASINGQSVTDLFTYYNAIQTAPNPRRLSIDIINWRDGTRLSGTINAIKLP